MTIKFNPGDQVEICCNDVGFENSYFPATIISSITNNKSEYIVQYNTLLGQDEKSPLREFKSVDEIRPVPPEIEVKKYEWKDKVDAYANDGWWKGTVDKMKGNRYIVRFDRGAGEVEEGAYWLSYLRVHQDWVNSSWVSSNKLKKNCT